MADFPKIIHQSWKNQSLREDYQRYSQTWKDLHPDYEYRLWTDEDNLKFIEEEDPSFVDDYNSYNHYIKRADAVRYYYMYKYGGIYADLDFECLRNFDSLFYDLYAYDVILGDVPRQFTQIPNAIMISKPGADFWLYVIQMMKERVNESGPPWDTGPYLLGKAVDTYPHKDEIKLTERSAFYELLWIDYPSRHNYLAKFSAAPIDFEKLSKAEKLSQAPDSYAVSYWSSSWKKIPNINENSGGLTHRGIVVEEMKTKADKNLWD